MMHIISKWTNPEGCLTYLWQTKKGEYLIDSHVFVLPYNLVREKLIKMNYSEVGSSVYPYEGN